MDESGQFSAKARRRRDGGAARGKKKSAIASGITSHYKETYRELLKTNIAQAAALKGRLISVFEYLGYNGKSKAEGWEKEKKQEFEPAPAGAFLRGMPHAVLHTICIPNAGR